MVELIEPQKQVGNGTFTASRVADQADLLTCFDLEIHVSEHRCISARVLEAEVSQLDLTIRNLLSLVLLLSQITLRRLINDREDLLR